ncbi:hypothetical protein [Lutibacter maritimus]|uniref:Uncharacterized protein n=1 Tax=Lutibacter maritimus TaxID=593133 RepID=A0A1I6R4F1_9FLAO|nr:hypothetical protein [Lutibacter maritimus]SFS59651.1 hypothetical protein SAMN04488006_2197 [Lutibacter maritimus]
MTTEIKKNWLNTQKSISKLHEESKVWISELAFTRDEIRFLTHLLSKQYIDYLYAGLGKRIEIFTKKMTIEDTSGEILITEINKHELLLAELIEHNNLITNINYIDQHKKLQKEVDVYLKKYKNLKKQIFEVIEKVMRKKNIKKIE